MKRFSATALYVLRNELPIQALIENMLHLPCKTSEGAFRFMCPECNEFTTGVNGITNLARCFRCTRNFNTIELVMVCRSLNFIKSVELLTQYRSSLKAATDNANPARPPQTELLSVDEILRRIALSVRT
jgi:hypothetical protein